MGVFGVEGIRRTADFWVDDDDIGTRQHKVYVRNLDLLDPAIIASLRSMLAEFPDWEIMVAVSVPGEGDGWPDMGLTIRAGEIIDGLRREYLPERFASVRYPDSRPGTELD